MKYIDDFRNPELAKGLAKRIVELSRRDVRFMMGGGMIAHVLIQNGLDSMLPHEVKLVLGPGCPRCVTPPSTIDKAIAISEYPETILTIHGGMLMIPGSSKSLEAKRAEGKDIRPVYSCPEALDIAVKNPKKNVIFVAIGYETTSPTVAATVIEAERRGVENFYVTRGHIVFTSIFRALLKDVQIKGKPLGFQGLLLPGPVSTVTGSMAYDFIPERHELPCVITGLEVCDILQSTYMLLKQSEENNPRVEIQYSRCVDAEGNLAAKKTIEEVFEVCDSPLRGFGIVSDSGLRLRRKYERFAAERIFRVEVKETAEPLGCICGQVLRLEANPSDCPLIGKACTPTRPVGPCMVDAHGTCRSHYQSGLMGGLTGKSK